MNLLYTITAYPPSTGGAQLHQHLLAQHLCRRHTIHAVSQWDRNRTDWLLGTTICAPGTGREYIIDNIKVHRLGLSLVEKARIAPYLPIYYPFMNIALPPIATVIEEQLQQYAAQADLIHNVRMGREALSFASFRAARRHNIPFVFTPLHHPRWTGWRYRAYIQLYRLADVVIALTDAERKVLVELGVAEERIVVTGIGPVLAPRANPEKFCRDHQIDGPVVLFLGQHYRYKGYRELLQATRIVWQRVPDAHFVFIGPSVGNCERDFERVSDRRIHRVGWVDLQEKTDALAACTLLCVPSTQESFGGVYTEAWSFNKPVIGCNIPAVAEVIDNGINGYLVEQDPVEIANRICDLLADPARAEAMGVKGGQKVVARFTWDKIAEKTEFAYQKAFFL